MKKQIKTLALLLTLSLLTIGVLSSFKSSSLLNQIADTWDPTDTGTDTDTSTDTGVYYQSVKGTCSYQCKKIVNGHLVNGVLLTSDIVSCVPVTTKNSCVPVECQISAANCPL